MSASATEAQRAKLTDLAARLSHVRSFESVSGTGAQYAARIDRVLADPDLSAQCAAEEIEGAAWALNQDAHGGSGLTESI